MVNGTSGRDTLIGGSGADTINGGEGGDLIAGGAGDDLLFGFGASDANPGAGAIDATLVASGLSRPVFATAAPGDGDRLFVLEQRTGRIMIVDLATNDVLDTPFLDIADSELSTGNEQGLLGLAFHPDYASNGRYYVNLTNAAGDTEIWEYTRGADPDVSATTRRMILSYDQPFANHNGGWMGFGPDGFLYISSGDGGSGGDPLNNAQNVNSLLGKILRIDVNGDDFAADPNRNYAIPDGNPYVGIDGADELLAIGLRNPWRISFDSQTGDILIADVGQGAREEVNFVPAGTLAGRNFGWHVMEGDVVLKPNTAGNPPPGSPLFTDPIYAYAHGPGPYEGNSITGGYVLRNADAGAQGLYIFADFVSGGIWTTRAGDGVSEDVTRRNAQIIADAGDVDLIASFAVDGLGRLYVVGLDGEIHRLTFGAGAGDAADTLNGGAGNDTMFGGIGDDVLNGDADDDQLNGGAGADTLNGGAGNDLYFVDDAGDVTIEAVNAGADSVRASLTWTLANNIENLTLIGNAAINGTGNALANIITGNGAANVLNAGDGNDRVNGGAGADTLIGGAGNDALFVDNAGDVVREFAGQGIDTVWSSISYKLGANVEYLTLTGGAAINGGGNSGGNVIRGNDASNRLNGLDGADAIFGGGGNDGIAGGAGIDTLTGGAGADVFIFDVAVSAANRDVITDYTLADTIRLEDSVFTAVGGPGILAPGAFYIGAAAHDGDDRVIYNNLTGALLYDADGDGAGAAIQFATLSPGLALNNAEFLIV